MHHASPFRAYGRRQRYHLGKRAPVSFGRSVRSLRVFLRVTSRGFLLEDSGRLADLDQVPVRVAEVAADLTSVVHRRGEELGTAGAPVGVDSLDVRHTDVEEA